MRTSYDKERELGRMPLLTLVMSEGGNEKRLMTHFD